MKIDIISLFPDMFAALNYGIVGRAIKNKKLTLRYFNPRDFTQDKYKTVDDRPYGGGPGMVMMAPPLQAAIQKAKESSQDKRVIYLSPKGQPLTQDAIKKFAQHPSLILLAGRYEGIDERLIIKEVDEEWSIGDYIVSGGEFPIMVLIDAIARLIPHVLGHEQSAEQDSFSNGLLDYPHYTRPEQFSDLSVPSVLLSGNHKAIETWRTKESLGQTYLKRPDLLEKLKLTKTEETLLNSLLEELEMSKTHEK